MVIPLLRSCQKSDTKRGGNLISDKHVLVDIRRVNQFFDDFCLNTLKIGFAPPFVSAFRQERIKEMVMCHISNKMLRC